jgi:hypothetical protein
MSNFHKIQSGVVAPFKINNILKNWVEFVDQWWEVL